MLISLIKQATIEKLNTKERMKVYESSYMIHKENIPESSYFTNIVSAVPKRDKIRITLSNESDDLFVFNNNVYDVEKYKEFMDGILDDEILEVRVKIDKTIEDGYFSVYDYNEFINDILKLPIEKVLRAFSQLLKEAERFLIFDIFEQVTMFTTKTMCFLPHGCESVNCEFDRKQQIIKCKEASYFYNFDIYEVIPDDFKLQICSPGNPLNELFDKIVTLLSISFISTSASLQDNQLRGAINGQRLMEYAVDVETLASNMILYKIYNWIYESGNAIDKIIIARNIISLHCKYISITEMDDKVMASIQSNYNLYLKENVKEYLELKNKVAEFISDIVSKTGEYACFLLNKFKSNVIAIFAFLFTVILANIVSDQPLSNIFTRDITILLESVLIASFLYLFICYAQSKYEINKVCDSYKLMKNNYLDILTQEDLNDIFDNDRIINNMKSTIQKTRKNYVIAWILFIVIAFCVIELVSVDPTVPKLIKFLKSIENIC